MSTIRVVIVDDHPVYAHGLRALFAEEPDLEVVGVCQDGAKVIETIERLRPDVVVLDVQLPDRHGAEIAQELKVSAPSVRILGLSASDDEASILAMVAAGTAGYLLKDATSQEIAQAIRLIAAGESYLAPSVARQVLARLSHLGPGSLRSTPHDQVAPHEQLTERELEVLSLVVQGESNKEIGRRLFLSTRTVENHVYNILRKIGVRARTEAVVYAIREGLVHFPTGDPVQSDVN